MPEEFQLLQQLRSHANDYADHLTYRCTVSGRTFSYQELSRAVDSLAHVFAAKLDPAATLLICSQNRIECVIAILAGWAAGLRVFPISSESSSVELATLSRTAQVSGVVGTERTLHALRDIAKHFWPIEQLLCALKNCSPPSRCGGQLILQSSGTTGFPRLVLRDANAIDAVCKAMVQSIGFLPSDRVLATLPLSHSYGIEHGLLAPIWAGSSIILSHGLDANILARELADGATILPTVPSIVEAIAGFPVANAPALRRIYSAGAPLPPSIAKQFTLRFNLPISQLYGATEVGSVTFDSPNDPNFDFLSVGKAMQGVTIRIVSLENPTEETLPGDTGQVATRADSMFTRYLDGDTLLANGFFLTGDLGSIDLNGRLTITGRLKLLIDVGGIKVNPIEVEAVLREHPQVRACVVVPMRQSETVCRVKAIVVPRDEMNPPAVESLRELSRSQLATYKIPRVFELRSSLPTTATGKVLRHLVEA